MDFHLFLFTKFNIVNRKLYKKNCMKLWEELRIHYCTFYHIITLTPYLQADFTRCLHVNVTSRTEEK